MAAAADQPDASYSAERIEQLLRCPICLDRFKGPKLLPCQHTFCRSPCLEGLWGGYRRTIRCPECRVEHRVPTGGVCGFPNNITLSGFLDLPVVTRDPTPSTSAEAVVQPTTGKCSVCGNNTGTRQCVHCDKMVCPLCLHSHMAQMKLGIGHLLKQLRDGLPQLVRSLGTMEWSERTSSQINGVAVEINSSIDAQVRALRERQTMLVSELDSFAQQEQRELQSRREAVELDMASVTSYCDAAERALPMADASNESDLVEMQRRCTEHLEKIRRAANTSPPEARRVAYLPLHADELQATIDTFGQIQFNIAEPTQPLPRNAPNVTMSHVANPLVFFDLPDNVDIPAGGLSQRNDPPFQSPRLDMSPSAGSMFPPIRQEALPVVFIPEEETTDVFLPPLAVGQPHVRDAATLLPRRIRDYMFEMDTSGDGLGEIIDTMRSSDGTLFNYDRPVEDRVAGFMAGGTGDVASSPALMRPHRYSINWDVDASGRLSNDDNVRGGDDPSHWRQLGDDAERDTAPVARTAGVDTHAPMSRGRTFVQPSGAHSAASDLPLVNNQSTSFNISLDANDGVRRRRRYEHDAASTGRVASIYEAKSRAEPVRCLRGSASGRFKWPRGVAVSPINDFVIVVDSNNNRVQVFDSTGRFVSMFGAAGTDDGEFDRPSGAAVNSCGDIIVSDSNNHRVQVFDRHGHFSHAFGSEGSADGQLSNPWGVAVDPSGFVYVCDKGNDRVQVFQQDGTFVRVIGRTDNERGRLERPHYVAVGRHNVIVVSDSGNNRVQTFSATGEPLRSFGIEGSAAGMLRNPKGVAADKDGFIVVADSGNNRVQVFREDGQFVCTFGSWGSRRNCYRGLEGIAIAASHKIVVSDRENDRIQIV